MMPVNAQLGNISYAICALVGAAMAVSGMGGMTLGTVVAFLSLNKGFNMPISQVSMQANSIIMALAGAERIFKMMDEPSETDEGYVTLVNAKYDRNDQLVETDERTGIWAWKHPHHDGTTTYHKLEGGITFTDVDFGYVPEKPSCTISTCMAVRARRSPLSALPVPGKTTITNLINRFYDIQDGKIRYDGINIHKIKKADLRRSLGIVLQDTHLFTGTVMENIRYGRLDATDEECIAAARLANADGFIKRLPEGYNTMLTGDGANPRRASASCWPSPAPPWQTPGADPGRGHLLDTTPHRRGGGGGGGRPDVRPHQLCHCAPPVHRPQCRLHRGAGAGPHHRARQPRRADCQEGQVLPAVHRQPYRKLSFFLPPQ